MKSFLFHIPTRFIFGEGCLNQIGNIAKEYGNKAILVTSDSPVFQELTKKIVKLLKEKNIDCIIYNRFKAEPYTTDAVEGGLIAIKEKCDFVVGLGGGSALDMAKGIAHCAIYKENIKDYMYGRAVGKSALPIIQIPTTAGTGSEGNHYAVFMDPDTNDKKGLITPYLYAKVALLDPELLTTLPKKVITGPGLDAFYHCIEAYFSTESTPVSEMYSLHGIRLIVKNLPKVYHFPKDLSAWQKMQFASLLGGLAIGASDVGIPHALGHPIGGLYHISHAETLIPTYKAYLEYVCEKAPEKATHLAKALEVDPEGIVLKVTGLAEELGMNSSLSALGIQRKDFPWIIEHALTVMGSSVTTTPGDPDGKILENILDKSF